MKILVKKFTLRHSGYTYETGQIADLPEELARKLAEKSPKEFTLVEDNGIGDIKPNMLGSEGRAKDNEVGGTLLDEMTVPELKVLAKEYGIDTGSARKKQDIIDIITVSSHIGAEVLPPAELNGPLK